MPIVQNTPHSPAHKLVFPAAVCLLMLASAASASADETVLLPSAGLQGNWVLGIAFLAGVVSILFGIYWYLSVKAQSPGTSRMEEVGRAIRDGSMAYLKKQVSVMLPLVLLLAGALFFLYRSQTTSAGALGVSLFFIMGVAFSYAAGYMGMGMATIGNQRTANQARTTFKGALETAFHSGAVAGMMTVGLGLIGACLAFLLYGSNAMRPLIGFGFGGSLAALFMRVGGGIFTKAADVGADMVGKIESGIPEDDPRNPATIADNVGDNVGDCAGMAADIFESYAVTLVAAIILGASVAPPSLWQSNPAIGRTVLLLVMYPFLVRAVGVVASIVGVFTVRGSDRADLDPMKPINQGFLISSALSTLFFGIGAWLFFGVLNPGGVSVPIQIKNTFQQNSAISASSPILPQYQGIAHYTWFPFFLCTFFGILLALAIGRLTEHFTSTEKKPVNEIAHHSHTGPATMIISGFGYGLESAVWTALAIVIALIAVWIVFQGSPILFAYGVSLVGLGLLSTTGYILAMDTFGPITDNANGIFEMSGVLEEDRKNAPAHTPNSLSGDRIVSRLDAAGNTTKALTKGFAIASAVIAAASLFQSFLSGSGLLAQGIRLDSPEVFIGLIVGGAAPYLFSAFSINAVGRAASELIREVRRQFREDPGILKGTSKPDYARCVGISTTAAQKELLGPGILAIALPVLVGFGMGFHSPAEGAEALGGYLAGAILSGLLLAVLLANAGGAWDNAKKKVEDGLFGGKGSDNHKAAVICDTVGDPFKDTAGPALNPLIKVMNLTSLLIAGIISHEISPALRIAVCVVTLCLLTGAVLFSKRGTVAGMHTPALLVLEADLNEDDKAEEIVSSSRT